MVANRTVDLLGALEAAHSFDDVWTGLSAFAEQFGFDRTMLGSTRMAEGQSRPVPLRYRSNAPDRSFKEFVESGRFAEDPLFWASHQAKQPFGSHLDWYRDAPLTPTQRELFESQVVQDSPFRITMPVLRSAEGVRGSAVFGGRHLAKEVATLMRDVGPTLWLAAAAAAHRLIALELTTEPDECTLSPRERECLLRLAQGERVDRIAERLGLSTVTVELHLRNARRKLGARTSPEAVAKAVLRRWIEL